MRVGIILAADKTVPSDEVTTCVAFYLVKVLIKSWFLNTRLLSARRSLEIVLKVQREHGGPSIGSLNPIEICVSRL